MRVRPSKTAENKNNNVSFALFNNLLNMLKYFLKAEEHKKEMSNTYGTYILKPHGATGQNMSEWSDKYSITVEPAIVDTSLPDLSP
jgi:hypothetical protein